MRADAQAGAAFGSPPSCVVATYSSPS
ncbi:MAG: hypothetical protein JWM25_1821, partial [Thermoleophilia bacterium]|nr:hypothetical protein [Thermoleophilia bacterium]